MDIVVDDSDDWKIPEFRRLGRRISPGARPLLHGGNCGLMVPRSAPCRPLERTMMQVHTRLLAAVASLVTVSALVMAADYKLTVSQDRLNQRDERAAELAADERRLRLDPLLEALADQPRQREEPADGLGAGARRHAGRRAERSRERGQSRSSTTASCTRPTAGARSTRSTPATRIRASSCGSPMPPSGTRATRRARAASRSGKTASSPTCPTAA